MPCPLSDEIAGDEIAAGGDLLRDLWSCVNAREIDGAASMIGFGRSYVDVGRVMFFFWTRVLYAYVLGYTGLDRTWI